MKLVWTLAKGTATMVQWAAGLMLLLIVGHAAWSMVHPKPLLTPEQMVKVLAEVRKTPDRTQPTVSKPAPSATATPAPSELIALRDERTLLRIEVKDLKARLDLLQKESDANYQAGYGWKTLYEQLLQDWNAQQASIAQYNAQQKAAPPVPVYTPVTPPPPTFDAQAAKDQADADIMAGTLRRMESSVHDRAMMDNFRRH